MITDLVLKKKSTRIKNEGIKRSLLKTISWRFTGALDTIFIAYLITGTVSQALSIGGIELVSKMFQK